MTENNGTSDTHGTEGDPYGLGYDERVTPPPFQPSPELKQKIEDVKDAAWEKLPDSEQVKEKANKATSWVKRNKETIKKVVVIGGVAYVVLKTRGRIKAVKAAKAVNDYAGASLLVTPEQAAQIHGFGKALRFDSELGSFVVQSATNLND
jgi:hypothetical protein